MGWRRTGLAAAVGLAIVGGVVIGLGANGGGVGMGDADRRAGPAELGARIGSEPPLIREARRATDLQPSEAALLATAAVARDERAEAKTQRDGDLVDEPSLTLVPFDTEDRYRYLRRVGAIAVTLQELGDGARRIDSPAALELAAARLRVRLDGLAAIVAGLELSRYLRSQRLQGLITTAIARFDGVIGSGRAGKVREVGERFTRVGRALAAELKRAAAAATSGDPVRARRLLARVDRRLGDIETAL